MTDTIIGKKFGKLLVTDRDTNRKGYYFLCDCDCGTKGKSIFGTSLKKGYTMSCGCYNREKAKLKLIDLTGKRFGHLQVIKRNFEKSKTAWECICDCGNKIIVSSQYLVSGKKNHCGCIRDKETSIIGKKYGMLTVLEKSDKRSKSGDCYFLCKCDCGNEKLIIKSSLITKRKYKTLSCGCYRKNGLHVYNKEPDRKKHILKSLYDKLKRRQQKLGFKLDNLISYEEFCILIEKECYYCGATKTDSSKDTYIRKRINGIKQKGAPTTNFVLLHNGIDRIDSTKGYEKKNVVTCCKNCNIAKNNRSKDDFLKWVEKVYNYYAKR